MYYVRFPSPSPLLDLQSNAITLFRSIPVPFKQNLKALIKAIRATKTLADERALIQKESAAIRTSFREEEGSARYNNVRPFSYLSLGSLAWVGDEC